MNGKIKEFIEHLHDVAMYYQKIENQYSIDNNERLS